MKSLSLSIAFIGLSIPSILAVPTKAPEANAISARQLGSADTENALTDSTGCKATTIIFARGTTETGNVGTLAGPPFFDAVASAVGQQNVAVQGVDYPADIPGFLAGGDKQGSIDMAKLVQTAMTQCPQTKVVMAGYSQGGQLVHNAATMLTPAQSAKVNSVVIFGDPDNGDAVGNIPASKVKVICHTGDNICAGGTLILAPHLTYSNDADTAAKFVKQQTGL